MLKTIKGIYENGKIRLSKRPFANICKSNVIVTFVDLQTDKPQGNARKVLKTLENYKGILAQEFTKKSSVDYVNQIREKTNQEWAQRIKRIGIK